MGRLLGISQLFRWWCRFITKWSLPDLISAIATTLTASQVSYEIICVDDGSTDGSAELLKQQAQTRTDLKAVLRVAIMVSGNGSWV